MPFVFPIMIHEQYNDAYGLIPIFMLASLFNVVVSLYGVIYVAKKKTVEIAKTAIYAALINIVSHIILIGFVGIYAAALSTMIGYGCMAIYRYFHSRRYIVIKLKNTTLVCTFCMVGVSLITYYFGNKLSQFCCLMVICVISVLMNKSMLVGMINIVKKKKVKK